MVFSEMCNVRFKLLTCDDSVLEAEQLGFVVTRDCGVRGHVAWQVGQSLGQVLGEHCF